MDTTPIRQYSFASDVLTFTRHIDALTSITPYIMTALSGAELLALGTYANFVAKYGTESTPESGNPQIPGPTPYLIGIEHVGIVRQLAQELGNINLASHILPEILIVGLVTHHSRNRSG